MKISKLLSLAGAALLGGVLSGVITSTSVPAANAASDEVVHSAGGVSYVSGGVGDTSIARLNGLARDFNLKLVFALKSGDYVNGVKVSIADTAGKTLVDTAAEGPWFLVKLPPGNYQIAATFAGKTEKRSVAVTAGKLGTVDFRWAAE